MNLPDVALYPFNVFVITLLNLKGLELLILGPHTVNPTFRPAIQYQILIGPRQNLSSARFPTNRDSNESP